MKALAGVAWLTACCSLLACAKGDERVGGSGGEGGSGGTGASVGSGGSIGSGAATSGGSGGEGATATGGGGALVGGSGGSGGEGGRLPDLCGNGVREGDEACDGSDFGGATCGSLGLGDGSLVCNSFCGIVASGCKPLEVCGDSQDNDQDGLFDCDDPDCMGAATCVDSCTPFQSAVVPSFISGDNTGKPNAHASSCSMTSGNEIIYQVTAPAAGTLKAELNGSNGMVVSIRSDCEDDASELACKKQVGFQTALVGVSVTQGQTVFVMVDASGPQNVGWFNLSFDMPAPEGGFSCANSLDDDADGYLDCDDATACQGTAQCIPGAQPTGAVCFSHTECAANLGDPICLPDSLGFPSGYCSEFCDLALSDCSGDAVCADLGLSVHGVCLDGCVGDGDCRPGYACVDKGLSSKVCLLGPEAMCTDWVDNDKDGLVDCEDPSLCQSLPDCMPGPNPVGSMCTQSNQCQANASDPLCLTDFAFGYPGGYCSEFCNIATNDCSAGGVCLNWFGLASGAGTCFDLCNNVGDCRPNYDCADIGMGQKVCTPFFFF
jgi:hypothetical protein